MAYIRKNWINRFPVCALVYREAAELLGYDPAEAKSMGLARAIFFNAAKNGRGGAGGKKYYPNKDIEKKAVEQRKQLKGFDADSVEILNFAGIGTYVIHAEDGSVRGFIGGKPIPPEQYDRSVRQKIMDAGGELGYLKLKLHVIKRLSDLSPAELNSKAVYKIYESLRDDVRKMEFLEAPEGEKKDGDVRISAEANVHTA